MDSRQDGTKKMYIGSLVVQPQQQQPIPITPPPPSSLPPPKKQKQSNRQEPLLRRPSRGRPNSTIGQLRRRRAARRCTLQHGAVAALAAGRDRRDAEDVVVAAVEGPAGAGALGRHGTHCGVCVQEEEGGDEDVEEEFHGCVCGGFGCGMWDVVWRGRREREGGRTCRYLYLRVRLRQGVGWLVGWLVGAGDLPRNARLERTNLRPPDSRRIGPVSCSNFYVFIQA